MFEPNLGLLHTVHMQADVPHRHHASHLESEALSVKPVEQVEAASTLAGGGAAEGGPGATTTEEVCNKFPDAYSQECLSCMSLPSSVNSAVFVCALLYATWVLVLLVGGLGIPFVSSAVFAWVWSPVLLVQMMYLNQTSSVVLVNYLVFLLITVQLYSMITLEYSVEFDMIVSFALLLHQLLLHIVLGHGFSFPVWVLALTTVACVVLRCVVDTNEDGWGNIVVFLYNTFLFTLVLLSVVMYPNAVTTTTASSRYKSDSKQP